MSNRVDKCLFDKGTEEKGEMAWKRSHDHFEWHGGLAGSDVLNLLLFSCALKSKAD